VWRWHFYAGLFCLPFVCWLAITGSVYLFRPDIEAWLDRPYEALPLEGARAEPAIEARAAMAAVPGSEFSRYEPPATPTGAAQVIVTRDGTPYRVFIHPTTLRSMKIQRDDRRPMDIVSHLHGQLLLGARGSMIVEVAASWAVVMILTGLFLWFPRGTKRLGGLLYPRLRLRGRFFWRDLHAVSAFWVSLIALFLLLSGMPWSANWGKYLNWARNQWSVTAGMPDWPVPGMEAAHGAPVPTAEAAAMHGGSGPAVAGMSPAEVAMAPAGAPRHPDVHALDVLVPLAARLRVPRPVLISPPLEGDHDWTISSTTQNRPQRVIYTVDPETGSIVDTHDYYDQNIVDKIVGIVIATHEGQLFGRINQAILLFTAISLLIVSASAVVMWWRRRPADMLGAPPPSARPRFSALLAVSIVALAVMLPLFGLSLVVVLLVDRMLLPRLPATRRWLGLTPPAV
jgi:uncharacterized iron-regulated membrane protein